MVASWNDYEGFFCCNCEVAWSRKAGMKCFICGSIKNVLCAWICSTLSVSVMVYDDESDLWMKA